MAIFLPQAVGRFQVSRKAAFVSFIIPALVLIFLTMGLYNLNPVTRWESFLSLYIYGFVFASIKYPLFLYLVFLYAKSVGKKEHFWEFVLINNWLAVVELVAHIPSFLVLFTATPDAELSFAWMLCGIFYCYLVLIFISARIFREPVSDAVMVPLASVAVNVAGMILLGKTGGMIII